MPRQATGSPRWNATKGCWEARVSIPGHQRTPIAMSTVNVPCSRTPECKLSQPDPCESCARAIYMALLMSKRVRQLGAVPIESGETVNEWEGRWIEWRASKGLQTTNDDHGRYAKWIAPLLGTRPIAAVSKRELEQLVQLLDDAVVREKIRWKTATNVWGVASKMFSDACRSKLLNLRARDDNPARDVQCPDRGPDREGPYLFPSEYLAIMRCSRVPARWKRLITLAIYCYIRAGELAAVDWTSVHIDRRYVHVHCEMNRKGRLKATKTSDVRKVPIEIELLPLLERMHEDANGEGRVVTAMPPREDLAKRLRRYVKWALDEAGVAIRSELLADDDTRRPLSWHDLRHTGITWRAVRGDAPLQIQRAAGHSDLSTTQRYINEAQTFEGADAFGAPFPPINVTALMGESNWSGFGPGPIHITRRTQKQASEERPRRDSKIADSDVNTTAIVASGNIAPDAVTTVIPLIRVRPASLNPAQSMLSPGTPGTSRPTTQFDETRPSELGGATLVKISSVDDALRALAKHFIDEGQPEKATQLLGLLKTSTVASVIELAAVRLRNKV